MGKDLLEPLLNWPLSSAEFWHCMLPLMHAHIMDCTCTHTQDEQAAYIMETEGNSQDEQSIGSDIQQPAEATHTYQNETWKRWLYQVDKHLYKFTGQNRSTCTTMIIQPQCSHSNTHVVVVQGNQPVLERSMNFTLWYLPGPPLEASGNKSCKTSAVDITTIIYP